MDTNKALGAQVSFHRTFSFSARLVSTNLFFLGRGRSTHKTHHNNPEIRGILAVEDLKSTITVMEKKLCMVRALLGWCILMSER